MLPDNLIHTFKVMLSCRVMLSCAPGNLTMLPGNLDRAPMVMLIRAPGQPNRAPSSLNRAPGQPIVLLGNREHFSRESLHTGAQARAGTTGNRSPGSNGKPNLLVGKVKNL